MVDFGLGNTKITPDIKITTASGRETPFTKGKTAYIHYVLRMEKSDFANSPVAIEQELEMVKELRELAKAGKLRREFTWINKRIGELEQKLSQAKTQDLGGTFYPPYQPTVPSSATTIPTIPAATVPTVPTDIENNEPTVPDDSATVPAATVPSEPTDIEDNGPTSPADSASIPAATVPTEPTDIQDNEPTAPDDSTTVPSATVSTEPTDIQDNEPTAPDDSATVPPLATEPEATKIIEPTAATEPEETNEPSIVPEASKTPVPTATLEQKEEFIKIIEECQIPEIEFDDNAASILNAYKDKDTEVYFIGQLLKKCRGENGFIDPQLAKAVQILAAKGVDCCTAPQFIEEISSFDYDTRQLVVDFDSLNEIPDFREKGIEDTDIIQYQRFLKGNANADDTTFENREKVKQMIFRLNNEGYDSETILKFLKVLSFRTQNDKKDIDENSLKTLLDIKRVLKNSRKDEEKERNCPLNNIDAAVFYCNGKPTFYKRNGKLIQIKDEEREITVENYEKALDTIENRIVCSIVQKHKDKAGQINTNCLRVVNSLKQSGVTLENFEKILNACIDKKGGIDNETLKRIKALKEAGALSKDILDLIQICKNPDSNEIEENRFQLACQLTSNNFSSDNFENIMNICLNEDGSINSDTLSIVKRLKEAGAPAKNILALEKFCHSKNKGFEEKCIQTACDFVSLNMDTTLSSKLIRYCAANEDLKDFVCETAEVFSSPKRIENLVVQVFTAKTKDNKFTLDVDQNSIEAATAIMSNISENHPKTSEEELHKGIINVFFNARPAGSKKLSDDATGICTILSKNKEPLKAINDCINACKESQGKLNHSLSEIVWNLAVKETDSKEIIEILNLCRKEDNSIDQKKADTIFDFTQRGCSASDIKSVID